MDTRQSLKLSIFAFLAVALLGASGAHAGKLRVNAADPGEAEQETTGLEVTIDGEGFDDGTQATFLVSGSGSDTGGIVVISTTFVNPGRLKALINVSGSATLGDYDIAVTTTRGRRGKGSTLFSVTQKGGGGNTNLYDGEDIPLDCAIMNAPGDNVLSDGLGLYRAGIDKVACRVGGTVQPNPSGVSLDSVAQGPVKKAIRKIDLAFGACTGINCGWVPNELLDPATSVADMQDVTMGTRPYPEQDYIQLMPPGEHRMAMRISPQGFADRYVIQLMERVFPSEFHQGVWCDLGQNPNYEPADAISKDVTVYIWPDGDGDSVPDGYTVTTGTIGDTSSMPPKVLPGSRTGTICSDSGPQRCGGPASGDMCNLLGRVQVQFTVHAVNQ